MHLEPSQAGSGSISAARLVLVSSLGPLAPALFPLPFLSHPSRPHLSFVRYLNHPHLALAGGLVASASSHLAHLPHWDLSVRIRFFSAVVGAFSGTGHSAARNYTRLFNRYSHLLVYPCQSFSRLNYCILVHQPRDQFAHPLLAYAIGKGESTHPSAIVYTSVTSSYS